MDKVRQKIQEIERKYNISSNWRNYYEAVNTYLLVEILVELQEQRLVAKEKEKSKAPPKDRPGK